MLNASDRVQGRLGLVVLKRELSILKGPSSGIGPIFTVLSRYLYSAGAGQSPLLRTLRLYQQGMLTETCLGSSNVKLL